MGENLGAALMRLADADAAGFRRGRPPPSWPASATACATGARAASTSRFDRLLLAAIDDCGYRPEPAPAATPTSTNFWRRRATPRRACRSTSSWRNWTLVRARKSARAGRAAGRFRQRREGDDRAFGQGAGVSGGVRGGAAQGRRYQPAGGGLLARYGLGARWRNPGRRRGEGRSVPARHPRRTQDARKGGEQPPAVRRHDARRAAPGAQLFGQPEDLGQRRWWRSSGSGARPSRDEIIRYRMAPDGKRGGCGWWRTAARRSCLPTPRRSQRDRRRGGGVARRGRESPSSRTATPRSPRWPSSPAARADISWAITWASKAGRARTSGGRRRHLSASELGTQVHALLAGTTVPPSRTPRRSRLADVFRQSRAGAPRSAGRRAWSANSIS